MKSVFLINTFIFFCLGIYPQGDPIVDLMIDFSQPDSALIIDSTQIENIWEIGQPNKLFFDSAYSSPYAICTDLDSNYSKSCFSSFQLTVISSVFGSGLLEFEHKYETDPVNAGGYIEISYDQGMSWTNLVSEKNWREGFYTTSDTIIGSIPAFTGSSDGWSSVSFYFLWYALVKKADLWPPGWGLWKDDNPDTLMLRFTFVSNEKAVEKQGWLIDNIRFQVWDLAGSTTEKNLKKQAVLYRPEIRQIQILPMYEVKSNYSICLFDIHGRQHIRALNSPANLNVAHLNKGLYIICIYSDEGTVNAEKVIIY